MRRYLIYGTMLAGLALPQLAQAASCLTSDISFTILTTTYVPATCVNDLGNGSPATETINLNTAFSTSGFVFLAKYDASGGLTAGPVYQGIQYGLSTTAGSDGTWHLTWMDTNGAAPANLPLTINFEVGLFGGNNGSGYLFENVLLTNGPFSGSGTFDIPFVNGGGQNPNISHMTITGFDPPSPVPEPLSLALFGLGVAALGVARRRT